MAIQLEITSQYEGSAWVVTSKVSDDSDVGFPRDVFLWTLDDSGALNEFQAIGHIDQVARYPLYDVNRTSNFGIHLVRYSSSTQRVSSEKLRDDVITVIKSAFNNLIDGYKEAIEPIIEMYP